MTELEDAIIGFIALEGQARRRDIANQLGEPIDSVASALARLAAEGIVARLGKGVYEYCGRWVEQESLESEEA
mgnify:CR=1 FL=1